MLGIIKQKTTKWNTKVRPTKIKNREVLQTNKKLDTGHSKSPQSITETKFNMQQPDMGKQQTQKKQQRPGEKHQAVF